MMGRLSVDQEHFFYSFCLDEAVPDDRPDREVAAVLDLSWVQILSSARSAIDRSGADDPECCDPRHVIRNRLNLDHVKPHQAPAIKLRRVRQSVGPASRQSFPQARSAHAAQRYHLARASLSATAAAPSSHALIGER
jgi:hypothetical protein